LQSIPLFAVLNESELLNVANSLKVKYFKPNELIIKEKEKGNRFYVIDSGEVSVLKNGVELTTLGVHEYFGERSLIQDEPRSATIKAIGNVDCLVLSSKAFKDLLFPNDNAATMINLQQKIRKRGREKATIRNKTEAPKIPFNELVPLRTIGQGSFGKVKLMHHPGSNQVFAIKCLSKRHIVNQHQEVNVMAEKNILTEVRGHPFILEQVATYQDQNNLYILMELLQGGELWTYIYDKMTLLPRTNANGFSDDISRFYGGSVVLAFEHIHGKGYCYRDLKPENLVMHKSGYIKMIDFGFAKHLPYTEKGKVMYKTHTMCGTPEYLAPELVAHKGHTVSADYWSFGCFVYELLTGQTPFCHRDQNEILKRIMKPDRYLAFPKRQKKDLISAPARDLIKGLLTKNPSYRLGGRKAGIQDIKKHAWFTGGPDFTWEALYEKTLDPPYVPDVKDAMDVSAFDGMEESEDVRYHGNQDAFIGFDA